MDILSYILGKKAGGGGGEAVLINKDISTNGTYNASSDSADGYKKVVVDVPNTYAAGDDGKVVSNGALVAQGSDTVTANDTYDTTLISSLTVNVSGGGGNDDAILSGTLSGTYTNNTVTKLKFAIFRGVTTLEHISLPEATAFDAQAFYQCTGLKTLSAIKCSNIASDGFTSCTALTSVTLPLLNELVNNLFSGCSSLQIADIKGGIIRTGSFNNCASLQTIVIRNASVANLIGINAFNGTPFASGGAGGDIYVPSALIDSYKAATNWSTLNGYGTITWHAIEGSIYETQYADGTPIT